MFFFEDFIKKIEKTKPNPKKNKSYGFEMKRFIISLGTGIPLILIGILQGYIGYTKNFNPVYLGVAIVVLYLGIKQIKNIFSYKILLNSKNQNIVGMGINLNYSDIDSCILQERIIGKGSKLQVVLSIITNDRKEIIIPLVMNKKIDFTATLKAELKERFIIIK